VRSSTQRLDAMAVSTIPERLITNVSSQKSHSPEKLLSEASTDALPSLDSAVQDIPEMEDQRLQTASDEMERSVTEASFLARRCISKLLHDVDDVKGQLAHLARIANKGLVHERSAELCNATTCISDGHEKETRRQVHARQPRSFPAVQVTAADSELLHRQKSQLEGKHHQLQCQIARERQRNAKLEQSIRKVKERSDCLDRQIPCSRSLEQVYAQRRLCYQADPLLRESNSLAQSHCAWGAPLRSRRATLTNNDRRPSRTKAGCPHFQLGTSQAEESLVEGESYMSQCASSESAGHRCSPTSSSCAHAKQAHTDEADHLWTRVLQEFATSPDWSLFKERPGVYRLGHAGGRAVLAQVSHGELQVSVGGGWIDARAFLDRYCPFELGPRRKSGAGSAVVHPRPISVCGANCCTNKLLGKSIGCLAIT